MKLLPASLLFGCTFGTPTVTQWQFEIDDSVYEALVHPVPRGFWESKAFCDGFGAGWQLPIPSNDAENAAVEQIAAKGNIYLGIAQQLEEGGGIQRPWHNIYTGEVISYSNWMNRQPNNFNGNEHYALMLSWSSGEWNDGSVDGSNNPNWQRQATGCIRKCSGTVNEFRNLLKGNPDCVIITTTQKPITPTAKTCSSDPKYQCQQVSENSNDYNLPDDYFFVTQSWGNRFYKVYNGRMTYNAAKTQCESDGAFLAIPRSEAENDYIADLIPNENIWIGINDIDQEGVFVAVDGSDITYTNWDSGEPNSFGGNEDAVTIRVGHTKRQKAWNDVTEYNQQRFVCALRIPEYYCHNTFGSTVPGKLSNKTSDGLCTPCPETSTQFCKENMFRSFYNYLDCEKQCNGATDPSEYLTADENGDVITWNFYSGSKSRPKRSDLDRMSNPMIVNYADAILFRGCYRGKKSCHRPLDKLARSLKKLILRIDGYSRHNRADSRCFPRFGDHFDVDFVPQAGMEMIDSNWNVQNWITGNQNDGFVYDGCAAFQKVLDAIQPWGAKYASHRCRHGQKEEDRFFEKIWKKQVRYFDRRLPELVGGVFRDAGSCNFKNGFE